jgi:hypothetical protein
MFIRFAERGTAVFHDLCVIVRVVDEFNATFNKYWKLFVAIICRSDQYKHLIIFEEKVGLKFQERKQIQTH